MKEEITARSILAETLQRHEMLLRGYSKGGKSLEPAAGFQDDFDIEMKKCRIIRELMQALVSGPVRTGIAKWQMDVMEGKPTELYGEMLQKYSPKDNEWVDYPLPWVEGRCFPEKRLEFRDGKKIMMYRYPAPEKAEKETRT